MKQMKRYQIAKLVMIGATILVAVLFVIVLVQNIQIKALEQQLHDIVGQMLA